MQRNSFSFWRLVWFVALVSPGVALGAVTVNWGNAPSATTVNYTSAGQPIDASYTFEFGVFGSSGPVGAPATWRAQWMVLDAATYNPALQGFQNIWIGNDDNFAGSVAAIWVHNNDFTATDTTEWALVSADDWIIPTMAGQAGTPNEFRVTSLPQTSELFPADTALFGGFNGNQGPGSFDPPPAGYVIQTHSFPAPIPEPGSVALLSTAGLLFFRRRRV